MFSTQLRSARPALGLVALLTIALVPSSSRAESIYFHNDTPITVTVYASCVFRGVVRQATPVQLLPKMSSPALKLPGNKLIRIQDQRFPSRILFQGTIPGGDEDLHFAIQPDLPGPRVGLRRVPPPKPMP